MNQTSYGKFEGNSSQSMTHEGAGSQISGNILEIQILCATTDTLNQSSRVKT
jgi:hypothetical protein